ncbi:Ig-like domain-containing protein [Streptomyces sp. ME19-01-6]|uniref:Ig-like domain-containing protein n=1 Tax=Streptomyces sp. ME19-01-6 TaxID=3028686 RepID=UPI0029B0F42E|nr:Ig-like domain-containing protein [Streptomyces sp. ME19-01-6]MDX3232652.1 Ig-like domain-containing protein [Streptomyces sp. ME19-01-6]
MPSPTITLVTVSPNPAFVGQSVTVTATVIPLGLGTPTGTVTFNVTGASPQTVPLTGGTASATFTGLSVGVATVTATYSGDANFTPSTGFNAVVVLQGTTTTSVVSSPDPSNLGQNVAITATVTPVSPASGTPTGTVTFVVTGPGGGTFTQALSGGQATINLNTLGVGSHAITAIYSGDTNFLPSAGSDTQTVNPGPAATTTTVSSSPNPSVVGQPVTFTANVSVNPPATGTPTGTVTFVISGAGGGTFTQPLSGGQATLTLSTLGAGSHTVTATYNPDTPNFLTSSGTSTHVVNAASTTTTVTSNPDPSVVGQSVSYIAHVQAVPPGSGIPQGTVNFTITDGTTTVTGSGALDSNGFAVFNDSTLPAGTYTVTATYVGNASFTGSTDTDTQTVTGP